MSLIQAAKHQTDYEPNFFRWLTTGCTQRLLVHGDLQTVLMTTVGGLVERERNCFTPQRSISMVVRPGPDPDMTI